MKPRARARKKRERSPAPERAPRVVILAAGVGSRMRSSVPKVLHSVGGRPLIEAVLECAKTLAPERVLVVLGPARDRIEPLLSGAEIVVQDPPLGTGDALARALPLLGSGGGPVVVLSGDVPLLRPRTLAALVRARRAAGLDLAFLSFRPPEPGELGRVVRDSDGRVTRIVEAKNATAAEKRIREANAGVYCFAADALSRALEGLAPNPVSGEYYLTDAIEALASRRGRVDAVEAADWREAWGINTRRDLAGAEEIERRMALERALDHGVTVIDPATTRIGREVVLERDVVLHPFVALEGRTVLGEGSQVLSFTRVADSVVAPSAVLGPHCDIEGARIGRRARVGPFSRLRPGTVLEEDVRVGNFVETKEALLSRGVKALHLSYLGDVEIGERANVGAGVITCNYDGEKKHRTSIGEEAFIGSDTQLVAPVAVGKGAYVGAGSTITEDVPEGSLALSRSPQVVKPGWVRARKAKKSPSKRS